MKSTSFLQGIDAKKAWTDLVNKLLDSPHYGERSAQHWLDVARYADTAGLSMTTAPICGIP